MLFSLHGSLGKLVAGQLLVTFNEGTLKPPCIVLNKESLGTRGWPRTQVLEGKPGYKRLASHPSIGRKAWAQEAGLAPKYWKESLGTRGWPRTQVLEGKPGHKRLASHPSIGRKAWVQEAGLTPKHLNWVQEAGFARKHLKESLG